MAGRRRPPWGWYRLDPAWAERLVASAGIRPGDLVLDIGAGDGALSAPLIAAGALVIAIELHPRRAQALRQRFATDDVVVVQADAADLRLPRRAFRVVANPPWAVTNAVLRRILHPSSRLQRADLVLKRSTVRRWVAGAPPGPFRFRAGLAVPRRAFRPQPPIDGRVLVIERRTEGGS